MFLWYMQKWDLPTASFEIHENSLIVMTIKHDVVLDVEDVIHNREAVLKLTGTKMMVMLIKADGQVNITKEAREESAKPQYLEYLNAMAIVSDLLAYKIIGNFFIKFNKPAKPTRFFNNYNKAIEWLQTEMT